MERKWLYILKHHEKKKYSQAGQDGVLKYIFKKLKRKKRTILHFVLNSDLTQIV